MSDYISFEARVIAMPWGDKVFTVLPLPETVLRALGPTRRVEGEFEDHPVNLAISSAPAGVIDTPFLWAGKSLLDRIGVTPGQTFAARLRPAPDDLVETPRDVLNALRSGGATEAWEALTPGRKRGHLHQIESARRSATRAARISRLIDALTDAGQTP